MCSGLNLPAGFHHSAAIASNFAISAGSTVAAQSLIAVTHRSYSSQSFIAATHCGNLLVVSMPGIHSDGMKENLTQPGPSSRSGLYPPIEPFRQQVMEMPGGHRVYVEQCGRPDGVPVVVLHGGPGGGCSPGMRRF